MRAQVRRKKGGWKALAGLWWDEVREVFSFADAAAWAGKPLSFVTVKPCDAALEADDALRKRELSSKTKNIVQAIRGRGKEPRQPDVPAITVYEKRPDSFLHCHMLAHVAPGNDALARVSDGHVVSSRPAVPSDAGYLTKQRLPLSPEFEATTTHKRQASVKIPGPRLSKNADAVALMAAHAEAMQAQCYFTPAAPVVTEALPVSQVRPRTVAPPISAPVQLGLFADGDLPLCSKPSKPVTPPPVHTAQIIAFPPPFPPPVSILQRLEERRIHLGMTQKEMAHRIGLKGQGSYANIIRGHDKAAEWVLRRAVEFLADTQRLAA